MYTHAFCVSVVVIYTGKILYTVRLLLKNATGYRAKQNTLKIGVTS